MFGKQRCLFKHDICAYMLFAYVHKGLVWVFICVVCGYVCVEGEKNAYVSVFQANAT